MKFDWKDKMRKKVFLIAEIGQAHEGSLGILHSYIESLAYTGVDAIKFQTHIAFSAFYLKGDYMLQTPFLDIGWKYPKDLFNNLGKISFKDKEYITFKNIEEFLLLQYGNWREPKRTRYLTYKIRTNYFNPFVRIFVKLKYFYKKIKS